MGEWQPEGDGGKTREISYTLALNYSFGPKFSLCVERHRYSKQGQPGLKHIVDTEVSEGTCCREREGGWGGAVVLWGKAGGPLCCREREGGAVVLWGKAGGAISCREMEGGGGGLSCCRKRGMDL